jgi:PAS domain S-box-containing protein
MTIEAGLYLASVIILLVALLLAAGMLRHAKVRTPWAILGVLMLSMLYARFVGVWSNWSPPTGSSESSPSQYFNASMSVWLSILYMLLFWQLRRMSAAQQQAEADQQRTIKALWFSEQRYRDSEERLRVAIDAASFGEWQLDLDTMSIECNERCRRNLGLPADATLTYDELRNMTYPDDRIRVGEAMGRAVDERSVYEQEYRIVRPDGSIGWVLSSGRAQYDETGLPLRMAGVMLDISGRKQIEQQRAALLESERAARAAAERASWMKDEFLATLSHELRTPMTAIHGWCQILRRERNPDDLEQGLEVIERNAYVQAKLIEDLLDMSRIISGKVLLDVRQLDLSQVLLAAIKTVRPAAVAKDIRLEHSFLTGPFLISGDANRLQQVFWNLLSNAIKFTPKNGRVSVSLDRRESQLTVVVRDTGQGIKADFLPFVFDRFRQADASTTRKHRGLGLGLAIVRQLVELHGGSVYGQSEGDGRGSIFVVNLPLSAVPPQPGSGAYPAINGAAAAIPAQPKPKSLAGLRVLVVDDEPDVRNLVQRLLQDRQAEVVAAGSMSEGLAELQASGADVLISDIGMPERDGFELIRAVRSLSTPQHAIPAIALTAYARNEDRDRAILAGFQRHATKPIEGEELVSIVADLCGR